MTITRSICLDPAQTPLHLHLCEELIQRSFHPNGEQTLPPQINVGESLPVWLARQKQLANPVRFACNTLHTNFVRGNGFVIHQGQLVCKPYQAIPLDGEQHQTLDGLYTALVLSPGPPQVRRLRLCQNFLCDDHPPQLAISGPLIADSGRNVSREIPVRLPAQGATQGDEINFLPADPSIRTSFTAFGITQSQQLILVSAFAGRLQNDPSQPGVAVFEHQPGDGMTAFEMADLIIELGAAHAILGGGSGDTQQYIAGQGAWCALPRPQPARQQVCFPTPLRGLGAILWG
jgi:hypothetical protein